ncbi:MAG: hypothetical protein ABIN18_07635 [Pseudomonadota bacterium]
MGGKRTLLREIGVDRPGVPTITGKPHLGDLILEKYGDRITAGHEDLKKFELIDRLEKPVLDFIFYGNRRIILEVQRFLFSYPYAFAILTKKGPDLWSLPERGSRTAYAYISRFPKLIKFIVKYEGEIPPDLWGLLYGYPLREIHHFTYDWETWAALKGLPDPYGLRNKGHE